MKTTSEAARMTSQAQRGLGIVLCAAAAMSAVGCNNAGQGAVTGASIGALSGLAIGSMFGAAGKGAAAGAVIGGAGGAIIGDQNRRADDRSRAQSPPQPSPAARTVQPLSNADRDRLALARFARPWTIAGWQTVDGQRRLVSGTATGIVENAFFVTLDIRVTDQQTGQTNAGDVWFASEPGRGITMNSRFDTSPVPVTHLGTLSPDNSVFTFNETTPGVSGRRLIIRFLSDGEFVVDDAERINGRWNPIGSLSFTASR